MSNGNSNSSNGTDVKVSMVRYNKAVKVARTAAQRAGQASWIIGDAALSVATNYGESTLKRFADDIEVEPATVRAYRTMAAKYPADEISRELQSPTVYGIFASQDDAHDLITDGNDGAPWTVSAARGLVSSRNGNGNEGSDGPVNEDSDGAGGNEPDGPETDEDKLTRLRGYRAQLVAMLAKTDADITAVEAKLAKATAPKAKAAPKVTAPKVTAPKVTAPKATAPKATAPKAKAAPAKDLTALLTESVAAAPAVRATRTARRNRRVTSGAQAA